jgi:putative (di)nucleoside polyphosphate hydrolase
MVVNDDGLIWVGERLDTPGAWQMPQGGIESQEDPITAAYRELEEEIGVAQDKVNLIAKTKAPVLYDLPDNLLGKVWKGKYRGQTQQWFLLKFSGNDEDINIDTKHPEFSQWKWAEPKTLVDLIVPFKRSAYETIVAEFKKHFS